MEKSEDISIDLVAGSVGRTDDVLRLLASLDRQTHRNFRLVLVEQVDPTGTQRVLSQFPNVNAVVLTSDRGLSRARNRGLANCTGDVIGFPDDDCWYEPNTLAVVADRFARDPGIDMLCGRIQTPTGAPYVKTPHTPTRLDRINVWRIGLSAASFFRSSAVALIGNFDPDLGVGSGTAYQSGEETDFFLRAIDSGLRGEFDPTLVINHPAMEAAGKGMSREVGRSLGLGMGLVLRRHSYPWTLALRWSLRPLVGASIATATGKGEFARFKLAVAAGRFAGYFGSERPLH